MSDPAKVSTDRGPESDLYIRAGELADKMLAQMPADPAKLGSVIALRDQALFRRAIRRFEALVMLDRLIASGIAFDPATLHVRRQHGVAPTSLYRWVKEIQERGLISLLENKRGIVGRKAAAKGGA